jgi:transcription elongation factor GreA
LLDFPCMAEEPQFRRNPGDAPSATLTRDAYQRLKDELEGLKSEGRTRMAERLQHARELGDISENAEFDAAKNDQGLMEARIRDLEAMLKDPDIIEPPPFLDAAGPGVLVTLRPLDDEEPEDETYLLAASKEEKAEAARTVTVDSPLGSALVGKKVGEKVSYDAPGGTFAYELVTLEPHA